MARIARTKKITVKVDEANPEPIEILAQSIIDVSEAAKKMLSGRLKKYTIVLLLQNACGNRVTRSQIEEVLDNAAKLKDLYLVPAAKKIV